MGDEKICDNQFRQSYDSFKNRMGDEMFMSNFNNRLVTEESSEM